MPPPRPSAAPAGFWREGRVEEMFMSVALASIAPAEISGLDIAKIANIDGEGKLSKKSCRTQLIEKGHQRIADYEARQRAGDDHTLEMIANNPPSLPAADREEANETQVQPRARPSAIPEADNTETPASDAVRRKRKKDVSDLAAESKSQSKRKKQKKERRAAQESTNNTPPVAQLTSSVQDEPARRASSRPAEAEVDTQPISHVPAREEAAGGPACLKHEPETRTQMGNPELQALGRIESSAINVDDLDSDPDLGEPAPPRSYLYKTVTKPAVTSDSLFAYGEHRSPLQPVTNDANTSHSTSQEVVKDQRAQSETQTVRQDPQATCLDQDPAVAGFLHQGYQRLPLRDGQI